MAKSKRQFTAIYRKSGKWYIGWIEEVPGVNVQGKTLIEARENMKEALALIFESNRLLTKHEIGNGKVIREEVTVSV